MSNLSAIFLRAKLFTYSRYDDRIKNIYYIKNIHYGTYLDAYHYKTIKLVFKTDRENYAKNQQGTKKDYSLQRARENLYRLVAANTNQHGPYKPIFFTLTTSDQLTSRKESNRKIKQACRRLKNYLGYSPKYVIVPELHESGAIHYHGVFFNLPYIDIEYFRHSLWGYGYVDLQLPRKIRSTAAYISKYLTKAYKNAIPLNQKTYFSSRGLNRPVVLLDSIDYSAYNKPQTTITLKNVVIKKYKNGITSIREA